MEGCDIHVQELGSQQGGSSQGSPSDMARRMERFGNDIPLVSMFNFHHYSSQSCEDL